MTRTEQVYEQLRSEILDGALSPAQRLKTASLSRQFGLSMTVIREALTRLAEQGLVVAAPNRGFMVKPLTIADLVDLTETRIRLEVMTLRDSILLGDLEFESNIVATLHSLERTPYVGSNSEGNKVWRQNHRAFHNALISGCGSPRLIAIASGLRDSADIYRAWSRTIAGNTDRDLDAEHRQIMELTLARDADGAAEALSAHIRRTTDALMTHAERTMNH